MDKGKKVIGGVGKKVDQIKRPLIVEPNEDPYVPYQTFTKFIFVSSSSRFTQH